MAEPMLHAGIQPTAIEIIPVEDVVTITEHYGDVLRKLEAELEQVTAEAEAAELRLSVHPAARVIDDDFEAFVLWATQSRLNELHRDDADRIPEIDAAPHPASPAVDAIVVEEASVPPPPAPPAPPRPFEVLDDPAPARDFEPPTVASPVAPPPVAGPERPAARRSSRGGSSTTVVTRPGSESAGVPSPVQSGSSTASNASAQTESFWEPTRTRTERAERPSRAERDARRGLGSLPSTLMLQGGAVFVIVALLVLKLG